jgi:hypothetical protein
MIKIEISKENFVTYPLAVQLAKLGYNEPCIAKYMNEDAWQIDMTPGALNRISNAQSPYSIPAPLWQEVYEWFSKDLVNWPIEAWIEPFLSVNPRQYQAKFWHRGSMTKVGNFNTRYEANIACLQALIKIRETFSKKNL